MMTNPKAKVSFEEYIARLKASKGKKPKKKIKVSDLASIDFEPKPVVNPWHDERIVYLVTHTLCKCGARSTQTNPIPMVRRWHPRRGIKLEAIQLAHQTPLMHMLKVSTDERFVEIANCHECISETTTNPARQVDLFVDWFDDEGILTADPPNPYPKEIPDE